MLLYYPADGQGTGSFHATPACLYCQRPKFWLSEIVVASDIIPQKSDAAQNRAEWDLQMRTRVFF
jgi:hypothetical protein